MHGESPSNESTAPADGLPPDEQLVALAREGDTSAFARLMRRISGDRTSIPRGARNADEEVWAAFVDPATIATRGECAHV